MSDPLTKAAFSLAGGEGGIALQGPSSGASASSAITAPFEAITGQSRGRQESPYLVIGLAAAALGLFYLMRRR